MNKMHRAFLGVSTMFEKRIARGRVMNLANIFISWKMQLLAGKAVFFSKK